MWDHLDRLWNEQRSTRTLFVFQMGWALTMLWEVLFEWFPSFDFFFGPQAPFQTAPTLDPMGFWNVLQWLHEPWQMKILAGLLVASLLLVMTGRYRRFSIALSLFLVSCFINLSPALFYSNHRFWHWMGICLFFGPKPSWKNLQPRSVFFLRLIQGHIIVIYSIAAFSKALSWRWQEGVALSFIFQLDGFFSKSGEFLIEALPVNGGAIQVLTYLVMATEAFIPVLLLTRSTRIWGVALGFALHFSFLTFMNINSFQLLMLAGLTTFLPWDDQKEKAPLLSERGFFENLFRRS